MKRAAHETLPSILTAAEMRDWERTCFTTGGLSEPVVMESAGRAAAAVVARYYPEGRVVAAVGGGNNGGDALVALRTLRTQGREVAAVKIGNARPDERLLHGLSIPFAPFEEGSFAGAGVILDGILGTGASGSPRADAAAAIGWMNDSGAPVVALDGPSGVDLTTGQMSGAAVAAAVTVTFGYLKRGLLVHPGRRLAGRILVAEVGFPPVPDASAALVTHRWARSNLPSIAPDAHKGSVGLVAVVAGRVGYGGAAILAAMGALRAGCGGVRVLSVEANRIPVHAAVPEAVFFARESDNAFEALDRTAAAIVGPGIGTDAAARDLLRGLLAGYPGRMALDADALTLLAADPGLMPAEVAGRCVLTPHPGELGRMLGVDTDDVLADRFGSVRAAAERFGCAVLSKGAPSLIAAAEGPILVTTAGHSGVATGGMGDTLTGIAGAMLAGGLEPRLAAAVATHFAGRAAEAAGRGRGLLPRDVAEALPGALGEDDGVEPRAPFVLDLPEAG